MLSMSLKSSGNKAF